MPPRNTDERKEVADEKEEMFKNVSRVTQVIYKNGSPLAVWEGDTVMARPSDIAKIPTPVFKRVAPVPAAE